MTFQVRKRINTELSIERTAALDMYAGESNQPMAPAG